MNEPYLNEYGQDIGYPEDEQYQEQAYQHFILTDFFSMLKWDANGLVHEMIRDYPEETKLLYKTLFSLVDLPAVLR